MEKKLRILFEVLFVVILCGFYIVKVMIPEYREKYGSSDTFIKTKNYQNLFEIKVEPSIRFAFVYNDKKQIYHILFLTKEAKVLYNRSIENHSMEDALEKTISLLVERDYLEEDSSIVITRYGDSGYAEFYTSFCSNLEKHNIPKNIEEKKSDLRTLAKELKVDGEDNDTILRNLDFYSKELIGFLQDEMDSKSSIEEESFQYTQAIYKKIDNYVHEKNLDSFSRDNTPFPIQLIPADEEQMVYPTGDSWYSYENGVLRAYIEIARASESYGYCYEGSIESYKKGEC